MPVNLTLRQIQAFLAVARNGSYVKASRAIGLSQPAVTANVRQLEQCLGVRVFDRTTRSVRLTSEGQGFLAVADRLMGDLGAAVVDIRNLSEKRQGRVVVACLPSVAVQLIGPLMRRFAARYPGVAINLYDGDALEVRQRVQSQQADFGIGNDSPRDGELEFVPLLRDRFCVVCNRQHPLARRRAVRLRDLEAFPFVALGPTSGTRQILDAALLGAELRLNIVCETKQISTLAGIIRAGLGVSVMPEVCVANFVAAGLVTKRLVDPPVERDLGLLLRRGRTLSPAAASFRDAVVEQLPVRWSEFATRLYPRERAQ
jgi:DNA-binding transcriptional LysR family regulator